MHSRSAEVADYRSRAGISAENDYQTACLIFSEKASAYSADNHNGKLLFVSFHVDSRTVACVALNIDFSASHRIACRIADIAVNDDFSVIHRVACGVLSIAVNGNFSAVKIRAEGVAGNAVYGYVFAAHSACNKALTEAVVNRNLV